MSLARERKRERDRKKYQGENARRKPLTTCPAPTSRHKENTSQQGTRGKTRNTRKHKRKNHSLSVSSSQSFVTPAPQQQQTSATQENQGGNNKRDTTHTLSPEQVTRGTNVSRGEHESATRDKQKNITGRHERETTHFDDRQRNRTSSLPLRSFVQQIHRISIKIPKSVHFHEASVHSALPPQRTHAHP